ncbi:MAG: GLUG motif-containing protein [Candidatus Nanohaloarchaea archaeon]
MIYYGYNGFKGQSAIEYLMTYGWMLLVVAIAGGAVFSVVGDQNVESVNGFTGDDVLVDNFGLNNDGGLDMVLRNTASETVEVNSVNVTDGGDYTEFVGEREVDVGDTDNIELPFVSETEGTNDLDVEVDYSVGGLDNLQASGTITGGLQITETSTVSGTVSASPGWENVEVRIKDGETIEERVHTDENGEYSANIESGTYDFEAAGVEATSINADESIQLDFDLGSEEVIKDGTTETTFSTVTLSDCEADDRGPSDMTYAETSDGELQIASLDQLQCMEEGLGDDYVLTQDIDASGTSEWNVLQSGKEMTEEEDDYFGFDKGDQIELLYSIQEIKSVVDTETDEDVDVKIVSNEEGIIEIDTESEPNDIEITYTIEEHVRGFKPIGEYDTEFTGSFDGQGYEVDTLYIDRVEENIGLFGFTEGSIVKNTGLVNNDITGANSRVGGLVGRNAGTVSDSYATGSVTGYGRVGGLVGSNRPDSEVSDSYATGSVTGDGKEVGGLVGDNQESTVSDSYATGSVTGDDYVGGLVGRNYESNVSESYATGDVSGNGEVGGLIGFSRGGLVTDVYATGDVNAEDHVGGLVGKISYEADLDNGFSTGDVTGTTDVGGLLGSNEYPDGMVSDSYWDDEASTVTEDGEEKDNYSVGGTALTTSEMQGSSAESNMDFDFESVWEVVDSDYPKLVNLP